MKVFFDTTPTSCLCVLALDAMVTQGHSGYMSAHGLAEVYAVLTRTPFIPAIYPSEARQIIEATLLPHFKIVALSAAEYQALVRECELLAPDDVRGRVCAP